MNRQSYIYFIAPVGGGPIKIGCSELPPHRLQTLAPWAPYPLEILAAAPGSFDDERAIHAAFVAHWSHSEWFRPHPDIYVLISEIRSTGALPERFRGMKGQPIGLPRKGKRKWTEKQKANAKAVHQKRWDRIRMVRAAVPEIRAFLERTKLEPVEIDKALGFVGITGRILEGNTYRVEEVLKYVRSHQAPPAARAEAS